MKARLSEVFPTLRITITWRCKVIILMYQNKGNIDMFPTVRQMEENDSNTNKHET